MSNTKTPKAVKALIKGAHRPRRAGRVNLRGDLYARIQEIETRLGELRDADRVAGAPLRLGQSSEALDLAQEAQRLREEMSGHWLDLTLESRGWAEWRSFKAANPPRDGDEYDQTVGVNFDALVEKFMPGCVVEPKLDEDDWRGLFEVVNPADLRDLGGIAYALHEHGSSVPLSPAASAVIRSSAAASERQPAGAPAPDATTDGSQQSSTSPTTPTGA